MSFCTWFDAGTRAVQHEQFKLLITNTGSLMENNNAFQTLGNHDWGGGFAAILGQVVRRKIKKNGCLLNTCTYLIGNGLGAKLNLLSLLV